MYYFMLRIYSYYTFYVHHTPPIRYLTIDGQHFNERGTRMFADKFMEVLKPHLDTLDW